MQIIKIPFCDPGSIQFSGWQIGFLSYNYLNVKGQVFLQFFIKYEGKIV